MYGVILNEAVFDSSIDLEIYDIKTKEIIIVAMNLFG